MTIFSQKNQQANHSPPPPRLRATLTFDRAGASAISLMVLYRFIYVDLPENFSAANLVEQRTILMQAMHTHYHQHIGKMPYQAQITAYTLEHGELLNPAILQYCQKLSPQICRK